MPQITYFILNHTYVLNTAFFLIIILACIFWMHLKLHASLMMETGNVCNDKVAQFFNKTAAEKCIKMDAHEQIESISKKYMDVVRNEIVETRKDLSDAVNRFNKSDALIKIISQQDELTKVQTRNNNVKDEYLKNQNSVLKIYNDYLAVIMANVDDLKSEATTYSDYMTGLIYNTNKKTKAKRREYVNKYKEVESNINNIRNKVFSMPIPPSADTISRLTLNELTDDQINGA